ncbi:MAG: hypothetical protein WDO73_07755 [Ignavibacteriota bacterium]
MHQFFPVEPERRLRMQRERLRSTYNLGDEILSASSPETILKRVSACLTEVLSIAGYIYTSTTRASKTLDSLAQRIPNPRLSLSLRRQEARRRAPSPAFTTARSW